MKTLIAFDLDGTLEDSRLDMVQAIQRLRQKYNLPSRDYQELVPWVSKGMPTLYAKAFDDYPSQQLNHQQDLADDYAQEYGEHLTDNTKLYDGILSLLQVLSTQYPLAVVTNKPEALSHKLLQELDIRHFFTAVVGGDSFPHAKPDPVMLTGAMQRCGISTANCIMIGDSKGDVTLGQGFGARTIWCSWGYHPTPAPLQPDFQANHPTDVKAIIDSLAQKKI